MLKKINSVFPQINLPNLIIYSFGQGINILSPLLLSPYIIYVCSEAGFGKTAVGISLAFFLILIVDYSFEIKGIKEVSENRENAEKLNDLFNLVIKCKVLLFVASLAIGTVIINLVPLFRSEAALMYLSMTVLLAQLFNPTWFLQGIEDFKAISSINILSKISYIVLVFVTIKQPQDYIYVNLILGCTSLFFNLAGILYLQRKYVIRYIDTRTDAIFGLLRRDFTFCLSQLFLSIRQLSPLLLASYFLGYSTAGQYRIVEQVIMIFRTFLQVVLRFFYPGLCYTILKDRIEGISYWKKYFAMLLIFVLFCSTLLIVFSKDVLWYFNLDGTNIDTLKPVFVFGLLLPVLMVISLSLEQLMFVFNKNASYIRVTAFVSVLNILIIIALVSSMKLYAVISALITADIAFIISYYMIVKGEFRITKIPEAFQE